MLLIENNENDVFLFRRALSKLEWKGDVRVVGSATEAQAYIEKSYPYKDEHYYRCPDLIVSDFKLHSHTAIVFFEWLKKHPHCNDVPFVILTGAGSQIRPDDLARMAPTGFIIKTPDVHRLAELLKQYLPA